MKYIATLIAFLGLAVLPLHAQDDAAKTDTPAEQTDNSDAELKLKQEKREATRILSSELKERTHILAVLKKVKDEKSGDKIGKQLTKEFKNAKKADDKDKDKEAKAPSAAVMKECRKKFKAKFQKVNEGIDDQLKRIEDLKLESSDLKEGIGAIPAPKEEVEDDSSDE